MTIPAIASLCNHVVAFGESRNWRWKASPVIAYEFATLNDFFAAKCDFQRAILEHPYYASLPAQRLAREISPDTCELDFFGVTFRLTCLERLMTPQGPMGAAEARTQGEYVIFDFVALQRLREGGGY